MAIRYQSQRNMPAYGMASYLILKLMRPLVPYLIVSFVGQVSWGIITNDTELCRRGAEHLLYGYTMMLYIANSELTNDPHTPVAVQNVHSAIVMCVGITMCMPGFRPLKFPIPSVIYWMGAVCMIVLMVVTALIRWGPDEIKYIRQSPLQFALFNINQFIGLPDRFSEEFKRWLPYQEPKPPSESLIVPLHKTRSEQRLEPKVERKKKNSRK